MARNSTKTDPARINEFESMTHDLSVTAGAPTTTAPITDAAPAPIVEPTIGEDPIEVIDVKTPEAITFPGAEKFAALRELIAAINSQVPELRTPASIAEQIADAIRHAKGLLAGSHGYDDERGSDFPQERIAIVNRVEQYAAMFVGFAEMMIAGRTISIPALSMEPARLAIEIDGLAIIDAIDVYVARRLSLAEQAVAHMDDQLRAHILYCRVPFLRDLLCVWRDAEPLDHHPSGFLDALSNALNYYAAAVPEFIKQVPQSPPLVTNRVDLLKTHKEAAKRGLEIFGGER